MDVLRSSPVALIAVHGVAGQSPGRAAQDIAALLTASPPDGASYRVQGTTRITLQAPPLAPRPDVPNRPPGASAPLARSIAKAFRQSLRSDMLRPAQVTSIAPLSPERVLDNATAERSVGDRPINVALSNSCWARASPMAPARSPRDRARRRRAAGRRRA